MSKDMKAALTQMQAQQAQARILRRPDVETKTGLSRSGIYAEMAAGRFPQAIKLTAKAVGWLESSVEKWIAERASTAGQ